MLEFQKYCESKNKRNITLEDCKYFYRQIIVGRKEVDEKYLILFTSAFIKQLSSQFGSAIKLIVLEDEKLDKKSMPGERLSATYRNNKIYIRKSIFLDVQNRPFQFFHILFHELYHAYQDNCYSRKEISYQNYRFIQENYLICEKYFMNPYIYYQKNYQNLNLEKMANKYGKFWAKSYLFSLRYGASLSEKDYLPPNYCDSLTAYDLPGNKKTLDTIFEDYIGKNKIIVWKESFFRYEYHYNGKRKSTSEILFSLEKEKDEKKIIFLKELLIKREFSLYDLVYDYSLLIKNRDFFQDQSFVDLLIHKYIYFKLERELSNVNVKLAVSIIDEILYKLRLPQDNDVKQLLESMKMRFKDGVKIRRKVPVEF